MTRDGFGNATEQKTIQGLSPVRPKHDQIRMPLLSGIDDQGFRLTLLDGDRCLYAVRAEGFRGFRNQSLRLLCFFVPNSLEVESYPVMSRATRSDGGSTTCNTRTSVSFECACAITASTAASENLESSMGSRIFMRVTFPVFSGVANAKTRGSGCSLNVESSEKAKEPV